MLLSKLTLENKALFWQLAILIVVANGESVSSSSANDDSRYERLPILSHFFQLDSYHNSELSFLKQSISDMELLQLEEYEQEIFGYDGNHQGTFANLIARLKLLCCPKLLDALRSARARVINNSASDSNIKKEVMNKLAEDYYFDITELTPEKMAAAMCALPQVKQQILHDAASQVISQYYGYYGKISSRACKVIAFELLGAAYSSGKIEDEEKALLQYIFNQLNIDPEYLPEFEAVMGKIFVAYKEAIELIAE